MRVRGSNKEGWWSMEAGCRSLGARGKGDEKTVEVTVGRMRVSGSNWEGRGQGKQQWEE
jgi:hypothetical protein